MCWMPIDSCVFLLNVTGVAKKPYEGGKESAASMVLDYLRDSREEEKKIQRDHRAPYFFQQLKMNYFAVANEGSAVNNS